MSHDSVQDGPRKPSAKQVYCLLHATLDMLGLEWPQDRKAASELIGRLLEANRAQGAEGMAF